MIDDDDSDVVVIWRSVVEVIVTFIGPIKAFQSLQEGWDISELQKEVFLHPQLQSHGTKPMGVVVGLHSLEDRPMGMNECYNCMKPVLWL